MTFKVTGRIHKPTGRPAEKPLPTKATMARNFAGAIGRNVSALMTGQKLGANEEQQRVRLETCKGCEFFRASDERCAHKHCGCRLKYKTRLLAERCPAGKW